MRSERWRKMEEIFHALLELEIDKHEAYLKEALGDDVELRREIEVLLINDQAVCEASFLQNPIVENSISKLAGFLNLNSEPPLNSSSTDARQPLDKLINSPYSERFIFQHCLGIGGFGGVYQVFDKERSSMVALKILRQRQADALYRFKREFRSLVNINHPNLITLYEFISDGVDWFFTMELVKGLNILNYVQLKDEVQSAGTINKSPGDNRKNITKTDLQLKNTIEQNRDDKNFLIAGKSNSKRSNGEDEPLPPAIFAINPDRLLTSLQQLVMGLNFLHSAGKLHCDIKPSNVLVTDDDRVVILDFGLITELTSSDLERLEFAGTPAYMSPEQAARKQLTPASDWYSVGVMLYQALTNRLPFSGSIYDLIRNKQHSPPPSAKELVSDIPQGYSDLCERLLARDPANRPDAQEIIRQLAQIDSTSTHYLFSPPKTDREVSLIGRERQLAALQQAYQQMKQREAIVVLLHGSSGMGKSRLVKHFLKLLQQSDERALILTGRCYEQETVPYKAFDSVMDQLSQYLKSLIPNDRESILPKESFAISQLFPVMSQVETGLTKRVEANNIRESKNFRRQAFNALKEMFARLAEREPLVVFVDDLQWGDVDSASLLNSILFLPDPPPMLFIGSYRSEDILASPFLKIFLAQAHSKSAAISEIVINELKFDEARELAIANISLSPNWTTEIQQLTLARWIDLIARETGGNPYFITELATYLFDKGDSTAFQQLSSKEIRLDNVIQMRITGLPEKARELLEVLAISDRPLQRSIAGKICNLDDNEPSIIAILRAQHLIRTGSGNAQSDIEIYHDRIRETVIKQLPKALFQTHHFNLAMALEETDTADPERLINHFLAAGKFTRAINYIFKAADQAVSTLAFDRAAKLYKLILEISADQHNNRDSYSAGQIYQPLIYEKYAEALANSGQVAEAAKVYLEAAKQADKLARINFLRLAAEKFLLIGNIDEGLSTLKIVLDSTGLKSVDSSYATLLTDCWHRLMIKLQGFKYRLQNPAELDSDDLLRVDTCWSASLSYTILNYRRGADYQSRHLWLALKVGEPDRIVRALALETVYVAMPGIRNRKKIEKLTIASRTLAEKIQLPHPLALAHLSAGIAASFLGEWQKSIIDIEIAEQILREQCQGVAWELNIAQYFWTSSMLSMGKYRAISQRLPQFLANAQDHGDLYARMVLQVSSFSETLCNDEPDKILSNIDQTTVNSSQENFDLQYYCQLMINIQCLLYKEEGRNAWDYLEKHRIALFNSTILRMQTVDINLLRTRAFCALAAASEETAASRLLQQAERDAQTIEAARTEWGDAYAKYIKAAISVQRKDSSRAIRLLQQSEDLFNKSDMAMQAAAVRLRRAQLLGGDEGKKLMRSAEEILQAEKIKNIARFTSLLAPGIS